MAIPVDWRLVVWETVSVMGTMIGVSSLVVVPIVFLEDAFGTLAGLLWPAMLIAGGFAYAYARERGRREIVQDRVRELERQLELADRPVATREVRR